MKRSLIFIMPLAILLLLLSSCSSSEAKEAYKLSATLKEKHFCYNALQLILETDTDHIDYCYNYPVSAYQAFDWYWLSTERLKHHMLEVGVLDEANNKSDGQEAFASKEPNKNGEQHFTLDPNKPVVYLTFDDGPGKYTDRVLDLLKEENIRATFFILGVQVERNPMFTKRIVDEGHTIGNHTYNHKYDEIYSDFNVFAEQVINTNRLVYELTGVRMTTFRAPGGSINNLDEGYFEALYAAGFTVFDWSIDSKDAVVKRIKSEQIINNITSAKLTDSAIVLLHDTSNHEQSMLALPQIIDYFKEAGYQFAPITSETEPITFKLGKNVKWSRDKVTTEQIQQFTQSIEQLYK